MTVAWELRPLTHITAGVPELEATEERDVHGHREKVQEHVSTVSHAETTDLSPAQAGQR